MEERKSEKVAEENSTRESEEMECDEALSSSDSAGISTDPNQTDQQEMHEASQMQSETSGIEIASGSTSASELPGEGAESLSAKDALVDKEQTEVVTSASELPYEMADLDANEKTEPSSIESEHPSQLPSSRTSAAELQSEESSRADAVQSTLSQESLSNVASGMSQSGVPSKQEASNIVKEKAASTEQSPNSKKGVISLLRNIGFLSPTKKSKSRSKSMSPSEKNKFNVEEESNSAPESHIASERERPAKEKDTGVMKTMKKSLSKTFSFFKGKTSQTENESLVAGEETEKPEQSNSKTEVGTEIKQPTTNIPRWTGNRTSLTEIQSLGGTTMTDVPSTSSSSEIFSASSSRKQSAAGESSEAAEGDYLDEPTSNVANSTEIGNEDKVNVPTDTQTREEAATAENTDDQEPTSNESAQNKENDDETDK